MGNFLEDLRRSKEAEQESRRQYEEKSRKIAEERKSLVIASKKHFEDSGLENLIHRVGKLSGEQFSWYRREGSLTDYNISNPDLHSYNVNHFCEITISGKSYWRGGLNGYTDYPGGRIYFEIVTTSEGEIRFKGDREKGSSIVPLNTWINDKNAIEEAFGRAYRNPMVVGRPKQIEGTGPESYNPAYPWNTM